MDNSINSREKTYFTYSDDKKDKLMTELKQIRFSSAAITVYRSVRNDRLVRDIGALLFMLGSDQPDLLGIIDMYSSVGQRLFSAASGLKEYIIDKILFTETSFSRAAEFDGAGCLSGAMEAAVRSDLAHLQKLASTRPEFIKDLLLCLCGDDEVIRQEVMKLPLWADMPDRESTGAKGAGCEEIHTAAGNDDNAVQTIKACLLNSGNWSDCAAELAEFHRKNGSGIFARYRAFVWRHVPVYQGYESYEITGNIPDTGETRNFEQSGTAGGSFVGVASPDPVRFSDLVSYELERKDVIENTLNFLEGLPANNILLYGDRGTGKSTTVKALVNEYCSRGLRLVEIPKKLLGDFPLITRQLAGRNQKFILFVDDLAFEDNEENYTALKAALEGGVESKPGNVLIYATSNRKHLIKERFSDRTGLYSGNADDEVRAADTLQEKLSLSDRFGMTVVFSSPDKKKYLEIVEGLARARGIHVERNYLHSEALKWEMQYNGRSPRTARQFVDWFEGHLSRLNDTGRGNDADSSKSEP